MGEEDGRGGAGAGTGPGAEKSREVALIALTAAAALLREHRAFFVGRSGAGFSVPGTPKREMEMYSTMGFAADQGVMACERAIAVLAEI